MVVDEQRHRDQADVVVEGIVLSGPRAAGADMASPARVYVTRYLKGRGPRVIRVGTGRRRIDSGDHPSAGSTIAGDIYFEPGYHWRIYGQTPKDRATTAHGVLEPDICGGSGFFEPAPALFRVPSSQVSAARPGGGYRWRAVAYRGPGSVRCVYLWRLRSVFTLPGECSRHGRLLFGVHSHSQRGPRSRAVVAAAPGLRRLSVSWPGGSRSVRARRAANIALLVLPGEVDPDTLTVTAFMHGRKIVLDRAARRVQVDDPAGGPPWKAVFEPAYPRRSKGSVCVHWQQARPTGFGSSFGVRAGECGDLSALPFFFAVHNTYLGPPIEQMPDVPGATIQPVVDEAVVFGAISDQITGVTLTSPLGSHQVSFSAQGRAFLAVLPASVAHQELTLSFHLLDGSIRTYSGLRQYGTDPPRPPALQRRHGSSGLG